MKFSIITPSYKQLRWLKLCLASVADQRGVCLEHIIQDAQTGSDLEEWVRAHSEARLFVESDSGMYDAINRGFHRATGDIVAWLNCDEQYLPGALAKVAAFFEQNPRVDVLFGDAVLLSEEGALLSYRRAILPSLLHIQTSHLNTLSCATFVRRSVLERGLYLKPEWKAIADAVWVADMIKSRLRMAVLPEPLAAFTMTETNLGQSSLAFQESKRWQQQTTRPWQRALRAPVVFFHRIRKFWHGAYALRNFATEIYTHSSVSKRVRVSSEKLSFTWTRAQGRKASLLESLMESVAAFLNWGRLNPPASAQSLPVNFYQPTHWPWSYWLVLPYLLAMGMLFLEEKTTKEIVVAPMLSTILMLILSFRLEPLQLVPFAVAFTIAIYYSLHSMQSFRPESLAAWISISLRIVSFCIASILAMLFSRYRGQTQVQQNQTLAILISLPMPVMISDALGTLIFANNEVAEFLKIPREELQGANYIKLFMAHQDEGTAMRDYIKLFQVSPPSDTEEVLGGRTQPLNVAVAGGASREVEGRLICLGQGQARHMVTVLKV